jgi:pilus assembly protein CpaE
MVAKEVEKPPFIAFASDAKDIETLKEFATSRQWSLDDIQQGDIRTATEFLKNHPSPALLLVELPSASEAPAQLDALAEVCDPDTKVITIGAINEYSFFCWLMEIGIFSYMLRPLTVQALDANYDKSLAPATGNARHGKPPAKVIAVIGTRGGVGASTISLNLAGIIADASRKQIALLEVDPHEGALALALDIEPSRGMRDALEKPERIDSLFVERVVSKPLKNLAVISSEETLHEQVDAQENAADALIRELRNQFDVVVMDVPRHLNAYARQCMKHAGQVVVVTELTLLSLRDALRLSDIIRETLKMQPPVIVVNRAGASPKQEMQVADFEKGVNSKVAQKIPFAPDLFMQIGTEIPVLKMRSHAAVPPMQELAQLLIPEAKPRAAAKGAKKGGLFSKK